MLSSMGLFDSDVLTPQQFYEYMQAFSEDSCYFYRAYDYSGVDQFPYIPLYVDHSDSNNLAFIIGLVNGHTPGKIIIQGVSKVAGFRPIIMDAFEALPRVPAELSHPERLKALNSLRRRLRHTITVLADRAGLESHNNYDVCPN